MTSDEKILNPSRSQELAKRHGEQLLRDLIKLFKDYRTQILALQGYIETEDFPQIRFIAHKIKGAAANIGAEQLYHDCDFFEELGLETTASKSEMLKRYKALREHFDATVIQLDRVMTK